MNQFKVGEWVVHLSHGVGIVTGIEQREFTPGRVDQFYILTIKDNGAPKKVFVPFESADTRLRSVADRFSLKKVTEILKSPSDMEINHSTWNRRYREYMDMIHSGELTSIAQVYVALIALKNDKELNFGERKLLDQARELIQNEFNAAGTHIELPV